MRGRKHTSPLVRFFLMAYGLWLVAATALAGATPSGRPPVGALQRFEPRIYDFTFDVTLTTAWQYDGTRQRGYNLDNAPIVMPVIFQGTFSAVDSDSLGARLWLAGIEDPSLPTRTRLDEGFPHHTQLAVLPVEGFSGKSLRWQLGYRVKVWSSRLVDEAAAAAVTWPREWPGEVADGLAPQLFIESDDPLFSAAVEHASGGSLRLVPPYLAAKDLVRYCINQVRLSGNGEHRGAFGVLHGMRVAGARQAASAGIGGPNDLVCVCVAVLRAAGIPARPVIGVQEQPLDDRRLPGGRAKGRGRLEFVTWAELYLPDTGWVPFDPVAMRGKGIRHLDVRQPWPEFGTMKDLNRRIPLAYHFMPPASVESPQNPAVWGWDPRPGGDPSTEQQIKFTMISRGRAPQE